MPNSEYIDTSKNNEPSEEHYNPHDHNYRTSLRMSAIIMPDLDLDDFTEDDYESDDDEFQLTQILEQ